MIFLIIILQINKKKVNVMFIMDFFPKNRNNHTIQITNNHQLISNNNKVHLKLMSSNLKIYFKILRLFKSLMNHNFELMYLQESPRLLTSSV